MPRPTVVINGGRNRVRTEPQRIASQSMRRLLWVTASSPSKSMPFAIEARKCRPAPITTQT